MKKMVTWLLDKAGYCIVKYPTSSGTFIRTKAQAYIQDFDRPENDRINVISREFGFQDGYIKAMKDFNIKVHYPHLDKTELF